MKAKLKGLSPVQYR
ncbi:TPA: hypothetical protein TU629_001424, partial [Streptococcus equi subsp. equi]|nr:hypothetical protein [Streptococcus equi subsp. equi]HEK9578506.1 hypothetical protein [Streptococcus equi subsp. equi]HEK9619509.1 hypothetical protein [Streptococcus equi subsp. equi]HEK9794141.1 hypothetical protein [Streptococcus equi subsp. equi]HEK9891441.1 hypothetical protein [Streptococcus equi subsp. equi]